MLNYLSDTICRPIQFYLFDLRFINTICSWIQTRTVKTKNDEILNKLYIFVIIYCLQAVRGTICQTFLDKGCVKCKNNFLIKNILVNGMLQHSFG